MIGETKSVLNAKYERKVAKIDRTTDEIKCSRTTFKWRAQKKSTDFRISTFSFILRLKLLDCNTSTLHISFVRHTLVIACGLTTQQLYVYVERRPYIICHSHNVSANKSQNVWIDLIYTECDWKKREIEQKKHKKKHAPE